MVDPKLRDVRGLAEIEPDLFSLFEIGAIHSDFSPSESAIQYLTLKSDHFRCFRTRKSSQILQKTPIVLSPSPEGPTTIDSC